MGFLNSVVGTILGGSNVGASIFGAQAAADAQRDNYAANKEFAQHGIRWKVEDAKAAGLHPLAALGMQPAQFSPIQTDTSWVQHLADAGSNIDRAIGAKQTNAERLSERLLESQIRGQDLENEYRASQLRRMTDRTQMPPALPGSDPLVQNNPMQRVVPTPGSEYSSPGYTSDVGWSYTAGGGLAPIPPQELAESLEMESGIFPNLPSIMWSLRNGIAPNMPWNWRNQGMAPPKRMLPPNAKRWHWNIREQAWMPVYN